MIRRATIADLDAIYNLLVPHHYSPEKHPLYKNNLSWNPERGRKMMENYFLGSVFIVELLGKPVGVSVVNFVYTYYNEAEADIEMFYVAPECRRTSLVRDLAQATVDEIDRNRCAIAHLSYHSGYGDKMGRLYENLWKKYGFVHLGTNMIRSN